jgi:hypothetical protein
MQSMKKYFVLILYFFGMNASADNLNLLPHFFYDGPNYTSEHVLLGRTCYSLPSSSMSLSCNPAQLALENKTAFRANALVDGHLGEVSEIGKLLINHDSLGLTEELIKQRGSLSSRSQLSIWYQQDWWAIAIVPLRFSYASFITNPAYPEIAASIVKESEIAFKSGFLLEADPNWQIGFELRAVDREFIHQNFALLDAVANPDIIKIQNNTTVFFEPGVIYHFANDSWKPSVSLALTNVEVSSSGSDLAKTKPSAEIGFAAEPEFANGKLSTATHLSLQQEIDDFTDRLRWAAIYKTDWADFLVSLARKDYGIGISTQINAASLGFTYRQEELNANQWKTEYVSTWAIDLGIKF